MKIRRFFMADEAESGGYGYQSDEVKVSPFSFGLNAGNCRLTKFEWIPNGGKDGAEQEALDIVFTINGTEKSYRMFPVVKAFDKNNNEITDRNAPEFKDAMTDFNARITHILRAFQDEETIKSSFARPIKNFKEFCQIAMSILPKDYKEKPLDIFMQYGWTLREGQERTYLEIPSKMKYGRWLSPAVPAQGSWHEKRVENPDDSERKALYYVDDAGNEHPFTKNGWFMNSNFAKQQRADGGSSNEQAATNMNANATAATTGEAANAGGNKSAW